MRDNHQGLPEILDAYERDGHYFGVVCVTIEEVSRTFEFGVVPKAYQALKRILNMRPFDKMPGLEYHYFFVPSVQQLDGQFHSLTQIRIEQEDLGKQFDVEASEELVSNLMWFFQMKSFDEASHLRVLNSISEAE